MMGLDDTKIKANASSRALVDPNAPGAYVHLQNSDIGKAFGTLKVLSYNGFKTGSEASVKG